jgi:lysine decarboxylase
MLVNGSTAGILAAIHSHTEPKDAIVIGRNCHKSVYNSVFLKDLQVSYIMPELDLDYGFFKAIDIVSLEHTLKNKAIKMLVITSPTYEGILSDVTAIASLVHQHGGILVVDEAHGAHLTYSSQLPPSALECGADIVVQSVHKTLPGLTQTALLHVSKDALDNKRVDCRQLQKYLSIYQTSSPSYILMSSIEKSVDYMHSHRSDYAYLIRQITQCVAAHKSEYGSLLGGSMSEKDVTRLTYLISPDLSTSGWELARKLREDFHMQVELSGFKHLVAIITIADSLEDICGLIDAIESVMKALNPRHEAKDTDKIKEKQVESFGREYARYYLNIEKKMDMYEAFSYESEALPLSQSKGKVMKDFIIPYPPGVPILVPGEVMSDRMIAHLSNLLSNDMEVYGIIEGEVEVIKT